MQAAAVTHPKSAAPEAGGPGESDGATTINNNNNSEHRRASCPLSESVECVGAFSDTLDTLFLIEM